LSYYTCVNFTLSFLTALSPRLRATRQRLGALAASNKRYAAHGSFKFALPLLRASAAIAPNRMLYVGIFVSIDSLTSLII